MIYAYRFHNRKPIIRIVNKLMWCSYITGYVIIMLTQFSTSIPNKSTHTTKATQFWPFRKIAIIISNSTIFSVNI